MAARARASSACAAAVSSAERVLGGFTLVILRKPICVLTVMPLLSDDPRALVVAVSEEVRDVPVAGARHGHVAACHDFQQIWAVRAQGGPQCAGKIVR